MNLNKLGVQEMNAQELINIDGGTGPSNLEHVGVVAYFSYNFLTSFASSFISSSEAVINQYMN